MYKPHNACAGEMLDLASAFEEETTDVITPMKKVSTHSFPNPILNVNFIRSTMADPFINDNTVYLEDYCTR